MLIGGLRSELETIERFTLLLNEMRHLPGITKPSNSTSFLERFERLKFEFINVTSQVRQTARTKAPEFNVFDLLGVARNEVATHSSMLAALLNPNGRHGQGSLFLSSFFDMCLLKDPENIALKHIKDDEKLDQSSTITEMHTPFGRLDIVVINPAAGFVCVVENKIDAYEQNNQLERYFRWMESMRRDYPYHVLVFLTVKGHEAITAKNKPYIPLSYNIDLTRWLEGTFLIIQAPGVLAIVQQYCDIASRL